MRKLAKRRRISGRRFSPCEEKRRPEIRLSQANGTEEAKKKKRKPGMQSTGGWTSLNPPPLPKRVETGLIGLRKSRKRGGSRECKVREVGTSLTPPTPAKKVLYVLQRFFCPVGDERSLSVILFSDW